MSQSVTVAAGDSLLIVQLAPVPGGDLVAQALGVAAAIGAAALPGIRDIVPTAHSVGVHFDPLRASADLESAIARIAAEARPKAMRKGGVIDVPVCYGGDFGPDLGDVAVFAGCTADEVVARHTAGTYRVTMMGFAPGFAYMGDVERSIAMPRRPTPRVRVDAGAVGIAGTQTGVYPFELPGGWQIIGRTPLRTCDFSRPSPFLFAAGDTVRFRAVDENTFARLAAGQGLT